MIKVGYHLSDQEIATAYDGLAHHLTMPDYFYPEVVRFLGDVSGLRILDAGCGHGSLLHLLAGKGGGDLHGLEMSPTLCEVAMQRLGSGAHIRRGNLHEAIPYPAGTFDLIIMTEVIEHLRHPDRVLREVRRVLRSGGRIMVTLPNGTAYDPFFLLAERRGGAGRWQAFLPWEHPHKTRQPIDTVYTYEEIGSLFRREGLAATRIWGRESFPYIGDWMNLERRLPIRTALRWLNRLRPMADGVFNRLRYYRRCYRLFIEYRTVGGPQAEPSTRAAAPPLHQ